jgi:lipopolysaccharide biosynthesis protein
VSHNGTPASGSPSLIAFYLPQFHPIPENDEWWGTGFTEWRNVVRARSAHPGHYQPHIPADLGFYDLRMPEAREAQAAMARRYGITAFCYYHYWFHGRRVLERPFDEVLATGRPDFPFCLCWANEAWTRNWDGSERDILIPQHYSDEDDRAHIRWLIRAFQDERYVRVGGRPLLMVYNASALPNPVATTLAWREECAAAGVEQPLLVKFNTWGDESDPALLGFDAAAEFPPHGVHDTAAAAGFQRVPDRDGLGDDIFRYDDIVESQLARPLPDWTRYQCVLTGWDNTPRRPRGQAHLFLESTPEAYERWLRAAVRKARSAGHEVVFINAWNEWAESAHLEPDLRYGRAYLEATARVARVRVGGGVAPASERVGVVGEGASPIPADSDGNGHNVTYRASVARDMEALMRQIQDLQDRLAAATATIDELRSRLDQTGGGGAEARVEPTSPATPSRRRLPVVRRLARTAAIIGRDWSKL